MRCGFYCKFFCNKLTGYLWKPRLISPKLHVIAYGDLRLNCNYRGNLRPKNCVLRYPIPTVLSSANFHHQLDEISLDDIRLKKHLDLLLQEFTVAKERSQNGKEQEKQSSKKIIFKLQPVVSLIQELESIKKEINDLDYLIKDLEQQNDNDLLPVARDDRKVAGANLEVCRNKILHLVIPEEDIDDSDIVMELSAGVGGQEAMLFTKDLYQMYCNFADFKGWNWEVLKLDTTDIGGLRQAHLSISGFGAYKSLKLESGVHRVQRVPKTERAGRIHTSTATVVVLPQPSEIDIVIKPCDLLLEFKRSSGAGGQHVNKTDSCVRLTHLPTGIVVECQIERCQHRNRELALISLRAKLYQRELEARIQNSEQSRKIQVASAARSEKVRTYNFPQNRITDHRLQQSWHDIEIFLEGQEKLNELAENLQSWCYVQSLHELLRKYN